MSSQPDQSRTIRAQPADAMRRRKIADCQRAAPGKRAGGKAGKSAGRSCGTFWPLWNGRASFTRRHGVGTVINRHVLSVDTRMDIEIEFLDMIRQSGHQAAVASPCL